MPNKSGSRIKDRSKTEMLIKRIIYIMCFAALCMLDQVIGSATGSVQYGLKNYTSVILGIIVLTSYRFKDFYKLPYLVWAALFLILRTIVMIWARQNPVNSMRWSANLWLLGVIGLVVIRMIYQLTIEKRKFNVNWKTFSIWLVMMLWMLIFRSDLGWPRVLFVGFLFFYLADFKKKDLNNLYSGMVEGIILGFFIVQGNALLHRPYDVLRYEGSYSNSNMNALFYALSYCAVMCKLFEMRLKKRPKVLRGALIVLSGIMFCLSLFTGGRAATLTMALVAAVFLVFQYVARRKNKVKKSILDGAILVVTAILCFVPTYALVRYVPAWVDAPVYYESDSMENKVQKGEGVESEKYIDLQQVLEMTIGRFSSLFQKDEADEQISWIDVISPALIANASEWEDEYWYADDEVYIEPGTDSRHPLLPSRYENDSVKIRLAVYQYFIKELNIFGHRNQVPAVWVLPTYCAPHTHNILLQIAYEFGLPAGILFGVIIVLLFNKSLFDIFEVEHGAKLYRLYATLGFAIVFVVFGMLEINWIFGQLPFTMFFVVQKYLYDKEK